MNQEYLIINLKERPDLIDTAASWFHLRWDVPKEAYIESMEEALTSSNNVPSWFIIINDQEEILAGVGVIKNDFHTRIDLTPNICALYVEHAYRKKGLAKQLLDKVCDTLSLLGINKTYLITTHTNFYERYGWEFYGIVEENDGNLIRMYQHDNNCH